MKRLTSAALLIASLFLGGVAHANEQQSKENTESERWQKIILSANVGFGLREHDAAYRLYLGFLVERRDWLLSFQAPVYGLMSSSDSNKVYPAMGLLKAHWDDITDIGRVINEIRLGREDGPAQLRLGRLSGYSLYQGTLVDNIYSQLNADASGLTINTSFVSEQGHSLHVLVVEPFRPSLVIVGTSIHPLAFHFTKNRTLSSFGINLQAYVDPTIVDATVNYGVGLEIEQSLFFKNVYFKPFTSYSWSDDRSNLGVGLEIGRKDFKNPDSWQLSGSLTLLLGQSYGEPLGALYLLERMGYPVLPAPHTSFVDAKALWPKEWHGSIKTKLQVALPGRFLAHYTMHANPALGQGEGALYFQGTFFDRWTLGAFLLAKKYSEQLYANSDSLCWLTSIETAVNIWKGLIINGSYSYLMTDNGLQYGVPDHQFLISFGYQIGYMKPIKNKNK